MWQKEEVNNSQNFARKNQATLAYFCLYTCVQVRRRTGERKGEEKGRGRMMEEKRSEEKRGGGGERSGGDDDVSVLCVSECMSVRDRVEVGEEGKGER